MTFNVCWCNPVRASNSSTMTDWSRKRKDVSLRFCRSQLSVTDSLAASREEKLIKSDHIWRRAHLTIRHIYTKKPVVEIETESVYVHMQSPCGSQGVCGSLPAGRPMFKQMRVPVLAVALAHNTLGLCCQSLHASCLETWPVCHGTGSWQREGRQLMATQGLVSGYSFLAPSRLCVGCNRF